jgi:hypothetical protein
MGSQQQFHTGLYAFDASDYPEGPYRGRGWAAALLPAERAATVQGNQIEIRASSRLAAQKGLNMIWSAHGLLGSGPTSFDHWPLAEPPQTPPKSSRRPPDLQNVGRIITATSHLPLACMVAAEASRRTDLVYALAKYTLSASIHANDIVDLDPWHAEHIPLSPFPEDHVRFAYGVVTAYAVVEHLGLDVRASNQRPSMINGEWNPVVKEDLEERLRLRSIDLAERISWNVRGPVRRIEKARPPRSQGKAKWARFQARDVYVEVIDAINDLSWLRSKVSAHKMGELAKVLSPYDVANGQHLARRLLLEALGFWRYWERRPAPRGSDSSGSRMKENLPK